VSPAYFKKYLEQPPLPAESYNQARVMRDFADPYAQGEFEFTGTQRLMVRDEALVATAMLRRFQQHAFPQLTPVAELCGDGKDASASASSSSSSTSADSASSSSSSSSPSSSSSSSASSAAGDDIVSELADPELQHMAGWSAGERDVDRDRVALARAPGPYKAQWAKKYVTHYHHC
jgi:hypothetical protein